jgi:3-oxoacyl-[acyl-carrier protein] reductase
VADRAAIVTGASAGIGLAVSAALARDGYAVTMSARKAERLEAAAASLRTEGLEVTAVASDAGQPDSAETLVAAHVERYGRVDVTVANAGTGSPGPAGDNRLKDTDRMTRVNLLAPFALARETIPHMRQAASNGGGAKPWFVIISSLSGVWPMTGFAAYSATKAAAMSLAKSINVEEATGGVRACAICPAYVDTDFTTWTHDTVPPTTMLSAQDITETVMYLLRLSENAIVHEIVLQRAGARSFEP